ncbi:hypothetical protein UFOVP1271_8 [uncultured Caudovirales phage]|uniref:Uncharacterized protein n=1 Tax=uncultured Caudovirales phage TaxID=2100421 RepID=A0A6J5RCE6_9CAUD|nr:hypothetical protein UFOVP1271_8 [uncultured Caudovirales phage]
MKCAICDHEYTTLDMRLRTELRGICFLCAEEGDFFGFTLEEVTRCVSVARAIRADQNASSEQRRHTKDMES